MNKVIAADTQPIKVSLQQDKTYFFCACGRSQQQPFCDGSHSGTGLSPLRFTAEKTGDAYLCQCKQTANAPYCDGSHKQVTSTNN